MARPLLLVVLGSALAVACGGAVAPESLAGTGQSARSDGTQSETGSTKGPGSSAASGEDDRPPPAKAPADTSTMPAGVALATAGACADRKASPGPIGGSGSGVKCTVSNAITEAGTGFVSIEKVDGDRGDAKLESGTLLLRCATEEKMLFQAAIRCFAGDGDYTIAPGDLVLGGQSSDRACRLMVDLDTTEARGFIECPNEPQAPDNVFASSGAPIGLGYFALARSF